MLDLDIYAVWHGLPSYRDAYGFAIRPQHVQRYREYAKIYKVSLF